MEEYPKYEKINNKTIKITLETSNEVPIEIVLRNKEKLLEQKRILEKNLQDIQNVIDNAKRLGVDVTPKPKDKNLCKEK